MNCNLDDIIKSSNKILLLSHMNPDGDTLGSMCALYSMIYNRFKKKADMNIVSNLPYNYKFLPNINLAQRYFDKSLVYDLVITLDVAAIDRVLDSKIFFDKAKCTINIDHHKTNKGFAKLNFIKGGYSSTGEVLFDLFNEANIEITKDMADCLYVAILTDTGCFRYETVTNKTFIAASKLFEKGVDTSDIAKKCYDNKPKSMVTFQADIISNAKFVMDNKVAYVIITDEKMKQYKVKNEHTEGIAETLRSINTVDISIVLKENENKTTKVSLRSKTIDLTPVVEKFNGGGHKMAAGCTIRKPAKAAIELILDEILKCLNS